MIVKLIKLNFILFIQCNASPNSSRHCTRHNVPSKTMRRLAQSDTVSIGLWMAVNIVKVVVLLICLYNRRKNANAQGISFSHRRNLRSNIKRMRDQCVLCFSQRPPIEPICCNAVYTFKVKNHFSLMRWGDKFCFVPVFIGFVFLGLPDIHAHKDIFR